MAIFAEVKFRRLVASANSRRLHVSATQRKFSAVIVDRELSAQVSSRYLHSEFHYRYLHAVPNWRKLFLHDVHVNPKRTIFTFTDVFGLGDSPALEVQPSFTDALSLLETAVFAAGKGLVDVFPFDDAQAISVGRVESDSVTLSESLAASMHFNRSAVDNYSFVDAPVFGVGRADSDSLTFPDAQVFGVTKGVSDAYTMSQTVSFDVEQTQADALTLDEAAALDVSTSKSDSVSIVQSIVVQRDPFGFVFTFSDTATDVSGSPAHSFPLAEVHAASVSTALQDAFTLDDFNQIDKFANAGKTNVYTLQDDPAFSFNKGAADNIITTESPALSVSRAEADTFAVTDTESLSPGKGISDSVSMGEVISVQPLIASAVLNRGLLGFVLLNAD
tara:strand:- start:2868 stop:4034 length:1167 start_codon:yes stop_codon:yes gene_type:complete